MTTRQKAAAGLTALVIAGLLIGVVMTRRKVTATIAGAQPTE